MTWIMFVDDFQLRCESVEQIITVELRDLQSCMHCTDILNNPDHKLKRTN